MFTEDGLNRLGEHLVALLEGGTIEVGDDDGSTAEAAISELELVDGHIRVAATFDSSEANFNWTRNAVKLKDGTVIDETSEDQGRKVEGSSWRMEAFIDLAAA